MVVKKKCTHIYNTLSYRTLNNPINDCLKLNNVNVQEWLKERLRGEIIEDMKFDDYEEEEENPTQEVVEELGGPPNNPQPDVQGAHALLPSTSHVPVIDLQTGCYLRPIPMTDGWIWRSNLCQNYPISYDRFQTLNGLSTAERLQELAGRPSIFQGFGYTGFEARPNVYIECQSGISFPKNPELLRDFFPNFDWSGLDHIPSEFLVKHGSSPCGSMILPTTFPFTHPKFPLPDDITPSGVRRGSIRDSVKRMLVRGGVDPLALGPEGAILPVVKMVFKEHDPRPLPLGNAGHGWSVHRQVVGVGNSSWEVKVVLPPSKPSVCIVGASHCDRMSKLDLSLFDEQENIPAITTHPHYLLWSSTAYLVTQGDFESVNADKGEIFAFFFASVKSKYQGRIHPNDHLRLVLLPFSWDILYVPIELQVWNLIRMSKFLTELGVGTDYCQVSHMYSEIPLLHNEQDYCVRTNICVREINNLINPAHVPVRIWSLRMVPNASDLAYRKVTVAGIRGMSLVKEITTGPDRTHLIQSGYYAWSCEIWDRAVFELNPPQLDAWRDFDPMNLLVVPHLALTESFFDELVKADVKARADRTDLAAASRLSYMRSVRVDMRRLNDSYGYRAPRVRSKRH